MEISSTGLYKTKDGKSVHIFKAFTHDSSGHFKWISADGRLYSREGYSKPPGKGICDNDIVSMVADLPDFSQFIGCPAPGAVTSLAAPPYKPTYCIPNQISAYIGDGLMSIPAFPFEARDRQMEIDWAKSKPQSALPDKRVLLLIDKKKRAK